MSDVLQKAIALAAGIQRSAPITLGATGPNGLVAWIESPNEIATLFVAGHGQIIRERPLAQTDTRDFGYEGCSAQHLSWRGEHVVVVTRERHGSFLLSFEPCSNSAQVDSLSYSWRIERDLLFTIGHDPGLVFSIGLPSLEAGPPLIFRGVPASGELELKIAYNRLQRDEQFLQVMFSRHSGGSTVDLLALPNERQRAEYQPVPELFDIVERQLGTGGSIDGRFIIEAVAQPFSQVARRRLRWTPSPVWAPVYWHRHLIATGRHDAAARFLDLLDEIALPLPEAQPEHGWDPGWTARQGQIELATRSVRRRSRHLAAACRSGELPRGWHCLLFDPAPRSNVPGSRVDPSVFGPTLRQRFERLAESGPERLPTRK